MKKIFIENKQLRLFLKAPELNLPKYCSSILNMANRFARATRPGVVGKMTELFQRFDGNTIRQWENWYLDERPNSIDIAVRLIKEKIEELKEAIEKIDDEMIEEWVRDLIIVKTFIGLRIQEAILQQVAKEVGLSAITANADQESRGIDGVIGDTEVSIKPKSFKQQASLQDELPKAVIYYEKVSNGIRVTYEPSWFRKRE